MLKRKRNEFGKQVRKEYEAGKTNHRLKDMRDWTIVEQKHSNSLTGIQIDNLLVSILTNGTSTQPTSMKKGLTQPLTEATSQQLTLIQSPTSTYSVEDFLVKLSALLENAEDSKIPEVLYSLTSQGYSKPKDLHIYSSKTSRDCLVTTIT